MGAKPIPTAVKIIRGNPGRRPLNDREAQPPARIPVPPKFLSGEALAEWKRVTLELRSAGLLTGIDRAALAAYCQAYGRWADAEDAIAQIAATDPATHGLLLRNKKGAPMWNPLVGIANVAAAAVVKYATEFGMTPSARSRIKVTPPEDDDPGEAYIN